MNIFTHAPAPPGGTVRGSASKKFLIIAGMILVLFIGIAIGGSIVLTTNPEHSRRIGSEFKHYNISSIIDSVIPAANSVRSNPIKRDADVQVGRTSSWVKVIRVIDGDTIEIEGGERVRYIGIDTPETIDPRKPVQCFGVEASNKNKELVEGKMARLGKDITDRDIYNRLLRYVWVDDIFVNLELVKQGFAYSYSYPPDIKYQDQFVKAQQEAREAKQGLWNSCPAVVPAQVETSAVSEKNSDSSCFIKGNISSSGEKIYHMPGCGSYEKTKVDEARGEKWFCSESEALAAGWRKALNCP